MEVVWLIFLFALGACVGSFLNVVIYRLPRGLSIVFPGSHCPSCGRPIRWYDNIPLVSYLVLRARCRACGVRISPRYLIIELATAVLVSGLYACYYLLDLRNGAGQFVDTWPMFAAHACLLCGLLACSAVDVDMWIVPLEVCWFVSLVGVVCAAASPHPFMPKVSPPTGAMSLAALVGIATAMLLVRRGLLQESFIDADEAPQTGEEGGDTGPSRSKPGKNPPTGVAITKAHGVNPRREILREVAFLSPAIILAVAAWAVVTHVPAARNAWSCLTAESASGAFARHFNGLLAAVFGYLVGGLWIWGMRIFGTLVFGKEAMGLGDVHILAAVGAVTGYVAPSVAFFVGPVFGILWALYLWIGRRQRELPYGPWLALGTLAAMLCYDPISNVLEQYREILIAVAGR